MSIFKCKMCGGTIEFNPGETIGICDSCGTKQTLPIVSNEKLIEFFNRANSLRMAGEFDKALAVYEKITEIDKNNCEAHWLSVLCKYGVTYVEDPKTGKRIPTVNRTQFTSVFIDEDYLAAISNCDILQKNIYEEDAGKIDEIQKAILAVSQQEKPFDIFICYKESDEFGRRTQDSVIATELYYQLIKEGFKVFFSRITLEDKLGTAYEPYIFAALNSSKVMIVLGTKKEYFESVWVKNEWSRYLDLIKKGDKKVIIPAYRDMDPYNLPEEFSYLQAQDMSKLGFMQDLTAGIKKIIGISNPEIKQEAVQKPAESTDVEATIKRAFIFLEDGEWEDADLYAEKALDKDPENAKAYEVKLMCDFKLESTEQFAELYIPIDENKNYKKIMRFGDDKTINRFKAYSKKISENIAEKQNEDTYQNAKTHMSRCEYIKAAGLFKRIPNYKDSSELAEKCKELNEKKIKTDSYERALSFMRSEKYEDAIKIFTGISDFKDSSKLIELCKDLKIKKATSEIYLKAKNLMLQESYTEAGRLFESIGGYEDADKKYAECKELSVISQKYSEATKLYNSYASSSDVENLKSALQLFESIPSYKDSKIMQYRCNEKIKYYYDVIAKQKRKNDINQKLSKAKSTTKMVIMLLIIMWVCSFVVFSLYSLDTEVIGSTMFLGVILILAPALYVNKNLKKNRNALKECLASIPNALYVIQAIIDVITAFFSFSFIFSYEEKSAFAIIACILSTLYWVVMTAICVVIVRKRKKSKK